jgi:hypothetical protein
MAHMFLSVDGFLHAESPSFFHDCRVSNVRFGISHDTAHVLLKADNKERDLIHQNRERGVVRVPNKFGLIYIEVNFPDD